MKLHEHPFASYCWKALIAFYEVELVFERVLVEDRTELEQTYALLNDRLEGRAWLADETFSLAECSAAPALFYARIVHRWNEPGLPHLTAYYERLEARPSVARVIEEARPYRVNFPLPWPDHVP